MRTSKSTVFIAAPPELVWQALTVPELVRRWQYGSDLETSWQPGSPIRFSVEVDGARFEQWGEVLEFEPPRRARYSLFSPTPGLEDQPENRFAMTYLLEERDGATEVTIVQEDPRPGSGDDGAGEGDGGENPVLAALRATAESLR